MANEKLVSLVAKSTLIHDPAVYGGNGKATPVVPGESLRVPESYAENLKAHGLAEDAKPAAKAAPKPENGGKGGKDDGGDPKPGEGDKKPAE